MSLRISFILGLLICLVGCDFAPARDGQLSHLGSVRVVYLDMDSNIGVDTRHAKSEAAVGLLSPLGASVLWLWNHQLDKHGLQSVSDAQQTLASLPFREQMYVSAVQAVQASPWASQAAFQRSARSDDFDDDVSGATLAMADGAKDAAVFIVPSIYLDNTGQHLYVTYHVTVYGKVIGTASDKPMTHRYASKDFSYSYALKLHDPAGSFQQQKDDAQLQASMSMPGALPYWMADDGAQLRKDFADALPKVVADLASYLGGPQAR